MKNISNNSIGIKQIIRIKWLDYVLSQLKQGKPSIEIRDELSIILTILQSNTDMVEKGEVTKKILMTNLMKIWVDISPQNTSLRNRLLLLNTPDNLPLHWISISITYPFWFDIASIVGRLLNLQPSFNHNQLLNRIKEKYGDRETVKRCTRYVLRSMLDWGCITEINRKTGQYGPSKLHTVDHSVLISLLLEMVLTNFERHQITVSEFYSHPSLFPFRIKPISAGELAVSNDKLLIQRQSIHEEVIVFK